MAADLRLCRTQKKGFASQELAETALAGIRANSAGRQVERNVPNTVYRCPYCQEWHLTHNGTDWKKKRNSGGWRADK